VNILTKVHRSDIVTSLLHSKLKQIVYTRGGGSFCHSSRVSQSLCNTSKYAKR